MSSYTVGTPPADVTFTFTESPDGTITNIKSTNLAIITLIGPTGLSITPPVSLAVATAIADGLYALVPH